MTLLGWTDAVLDFFESLEVDNSRAYRHAHKRVLRASAPLVTWLDTHVGASETERGAPRIR